MNSYDFYSEINCLIEMLRKKSFLQQAKTLKDAVDSGSTGSEIFMALRWHLNKILQDDEDYELCIKMKIKSILNELDKALKL